MTINAAPAQMTTKEIVEPSRRHTFFSSSTQGAIDPIATTSPTGR